MYSDTEGVTTVSAKYWFQVAKYEQKKNIEVRHQHGGGLATVFVLDTSESMADGGFQQMKDIFISIISEISKNPQYDDNVAVVTFGQTIKFTHYLTNNYESLKQCLDHISCSGPSPIAGAIALSSAVFYGGGLTSVLGEWHVRTRVIVMTDGRATDSTVLNGPEDQAFYDLDRVKAHLLQVLQNMGRKNPVTFIPVGDPDMSFLEFMSGASNSGRLVLPSDAKQLGRYSLHMQIAPGLRNPKFDDEDYTRAALSALRKANKGIHLEHKDMDNIRDLVANKDVFRSEEDIDDDDEELSIGDMERYLLPLGTRVRRGPHWQWKNQDSDGPGTVVGYNGDLWTRVEWDTGLRMNYRYNLQEEDEYVFDIVECSEPRVLLDGEKVAVGCLVTRGPDWKWGDQDGYKGQTGVVYKFKHRGIVYVRWQSGVKSNYRFGFDGKFDVQVCDPFSTELDSNQKDAKVAEFPVQFDDPSKQSYAQGKKSTVDTSERSNIPWQISRKSLKDKRHEHNLSASDVNVCAFCNSKIQNSDVEIKTERNPSYSEKLCSKGNNTNSPVLKGPNLLSATDETFHAKITKEESNTSLDDTSKECKKPLQASEGQHENYVWQWQDCKEKWITYPDSINDILNSRFQRNSTSIIAIEMDNQCYRIDMQRFQQRNTATNEVTEIRQRYLVQDE